MRLLRRHFRNDGAVGPLRRHGRKADPADGHINAYLLAWGQHALLHSPLQFYDAPAVIIIVVDASLGGAWPVLDVGLVAQNIVLVAQERGLGTCIMRAIVDYPESIRQVAQIPDSKRIILGIAIGHPDWEQPINQLRTERESIERILTFVR